jgi:hypothetical protein
MLLPSGSGLNSPHPFFLSLLRGVSMSRSEQADIPAVAQDRTVHMDAMQVCKDVSAQLLSRYGMNRLLALQAAKLSAQ